MSRPTDVPNATASLVAASAVADRKLLASFIAWANPGRSPTRRRRSLRPARTGSTRARASSCAGDAARHRRVDVRDAVVGEQRAHALGGAHPDRRRVDDVGGATAARRDDLARHLLGRGAVRQAEHHDVRAARDGGDAVHERHPFGCALRAGGVVRDDGVLGRDEVRGERVAHVAQTDAADRPVHPRAHPRSARTAVTARRAETPAGPPQYAAIWNRSSSTSASVTPARVDAATWIRNSSIRPRAAVIAITSKLRSRVLSGPPRAQTPHAIDVM